MALPPVPALAAYQHLPWVWPLCTFGLRLGLALLQREPLMPELGLPPLAACWIRLK